MRNCVGSEFVINNYQFEGISDCYGGAYTWDQYGYVDTLNDSSGGGLIN